MLRKGYVKYIKSRFFARLLLLNTAIVLLMMAILVTLITRSVADQNSEKELSFNTQILESVSKYYEQKLDVVRQMIEQIYYDPASYGYIFALMEQPDTESYEYRTNRVKLETYLNSNFTRDKDITNIAIYSKLNDEAFLISTNLWRIRDEKYFKTLDWFKDFNNELYGLRLTPAYVDNLTPGEQRWIYTIGSNLKSQDITANTGVLLVNFDAASIENAYLPYKNRVKGNILIVSADGQPIYDSKGVYAPVDEPLRQRITDAGSGDGSAGTVSTTVGSRIVNVLPTGDGVYVVGLIEKAEMFREVNELKRYLFLLGLACAGLTIALNGAAMSVFTQKVRRIIRAIAHPPEGFLTQRTRLEVSDDEIGQLAFRFNVLQDKLTDYVNEVYIADIRYKNAALAALQAQINPHFLSNTLEAIRMKAVREGNEDVGEMIYILSFLLRTSLKQQPWVSVREEISYCELYLQLFTLRYPDKLRIEIDVDPELEPMAIGKLTLQPIVENSVQHGVNFKQGKNTIRITGRRRGDDAVIEITDNGSGIKPEELARLRARLAGTPEPADDEGAAEPASSDRAGHSGIGLLNVHERLKLQFGERYGLEVDSGEAGTTVRIRWPARRLEEMDHV
ncbi:sensor histidine kinase [Cohnella fermenti]|uniref:histidine kinase n=1 Tax=Cohnella fermenti TaxID=2565925 RepID=A0A4S4BMV9_9BACL|nr:sensor histidine kinase [Cohnella fermenti]THF75248.1 sensor histidine kinase [Cohnella fermenti]